MSFKSITVTIINNNDSDLLSPALINKDSIYYEKNFIYNNIQYNNSLERNLKIISRKSKVKKAIKNNRYDFVYYDNNLNEYIIELLHNYTNINNIEIYLK